MADSGGGNAFLGFVFGGVVAVLIVFAFIIYSGAPPATQTVKLDLPRVAATK